ncbi:LpxI family protein [Candidatus Omnitrophota bacterium]
MRLPIPGKKRVIEKIGLLAGGGEIPIIFARQAKKCGAAVIAFAIKDQAHEDLEGAVDAIRWVSLKELDKIPRALKEEKIRYVVMLGKINKSNIFKDEDGANESVKKAFSYFKDKRDYAMLKGAVNVLFAFGVEVLDSTTFLEDFISRKGVMTERRPTDAELKDIKIGRSAARALARFDIGQTVCVKDRVVLAMEGPEGTDATIKRAGSFGKKGIAVIKMARPRQDMRLDVPLVGKETLQAMIDSGASLLAIEKNKTMLVDKANVIKMADEAGISMIGID